MRIAVELRGVVELAPRVDVTPLPGAPAVVDGVCRCRGELAVVVDLRARFGLAAERRLSDHFVIVRTQRRLVALVADRVVDLRQVPDEAIVPTTLKLPRVKGIAELADGVLLVVDVDAALGLDEELEVQQAVEALGALG